MMTDWTTIEEYLSNRLSADQRIRFEADLQTDPALAESVAFYVTARHTLRQEAHNLRRAELLARKPQLARQTSWPFALAAAACLALLLGIGWILWTPQTTPPELADAYLEQKNALTHPSVTMSATTDSLQQSLGFIEKEQLAEADQWLSDLRQRQPANAEVLKWGGIVALRRGNYDKAISQFQTLSRRTDLYANPGLFLEALTRMKRNLPDDKVMAKTLLQTVVSQKLEGSEEAKVLLEKL